MSKQLASQEDEPKNGAYFVLRQVRNGKDETEKEKEKKKKKKRGKGKGGKGRRRARSARRDRARSAQWQTSVSDLKVLVGVTV